MTLESPGPGLRGKIDHHREMDFEIETDHSGLAIDQTKALVHAQASLEVVVPLA